MQEEQFDYISRVYPDLAKIRYIVVGDGKSGTSTMCASFNQKSKRCIHTHGNGSFWKQYPNLRQKNVDLNVFYRWLYSISNRKPLVIYTFREPVSRTISAFFENIRQLTTLAERQSTDTLCEVMNRNFDTQEKYHCCDHPWFDGFETYSHEFDKTKGWSFYETEHIRILHLKFEKIETWEEAIQSILSFEELSDFEFTKDRTHTGGEYNHLYIQTKQQFSPSLDKLDSLFNIHSKFLEHFYTNDEILSLKEFWYSKSKMQK